MAKQSVQHNKIYFRNLDSIRFFAALMVFLQHGMSPGYAYLPIHGTVLERFLYAISNGGTGVSIFFVLSGFLITYLILSEIEITGKLSVKNFYIRRVLRIWPLYFAVVIVANILFPVLSVLLKKPINEGSSLLNQLTFLSNFDLIGIEKLRPGSEIMMQSITWSVAIEEQFYIFWPLIFAFLPRKFILPSIVSVIIGSLLFRFCHSDDRVVLYFNTLSVMMYLGTGALYAYLIVSSQKIRLFFEQTSTATIFTSFILFFISIMYGDMLYCSKTGGFLLPLFYALLFGFIIASQSMIMKPSKLELGRIKFAGKFGKYTYGIYLLHPIALEIIFIMGKAVHIYPNSFMAGFGSAICALILTLFLSWLSYEYFEKKFLNLKKMFGSITKE